MPFEDVPEGERRREEAEEKIWKCQRHDERVARVQSEFGRREDDAEDAEVEEGAARHHRDVEAEQEVVDKIGNVSVPQNLANALKIKKKKIE